MMTRQMDIGTLQTCHRVEWRSHGLLHVLSWGRHMEVVDVVNRLTGLSRTSQRSWGNGFWASHVISGICVAWSVSGKVSKLSETQKCF